jgi:hypothetical protein
MLYVCYMQTPCKCNQKPWLWKLKIGDAWLYG